MRVEESRRGGVMAVAERARRWFEWFERHGQAVVLHLFFLWVLLALAEQPLQAGMAADPWSMAASQLCTLFTGIVGRGLAVVAVIYGGLTYAFGEGGSKSALAGIIFGVGMVLLAPQMLVYFFGGTAITC